MDKSEIGDPIGSESCAEIDSDVSAPPPPHRPRNRRRSKRAEAEYPPPISCLARTEDRPSNMPWVMKRYYTGDGRLVITEERVKHHEYFQVHRSNGRLVLNLVPLDDAVEEEAEEDQGEIEVNGGGGDEGICDPTVGELVPRCYSYNNNNDNSLGVSTCGGYAVVVPAAFRPPVHT